MKYHRSSFVSQAFFCFSLLFTFLDPTDAQISDHPTANISTTWTNTPSSIPNSINFNDNSTMRPILLQKIPENQTLYACGFYYNVSAPNHGFTFAILKIGFDLSLNMFWTLRDGQSLLWHADTNKTVKENATIQFTKGGDLILRDADGSFVWSTDTSGKSITIMNLTNTGNLVLSNHNDQIVWQSSDHPADSLPNAVPPTIWTNNPVSIPHSVSFKDGSSVRAILRSNLPTYGLSFACGFFCNGTCDTFVLSIFIVQTNSLSDISSTTVTPQVVWSANPSRPVKENSTLQLTEEGNLVLRDADKYEVWSTKTSGKSAIGMNLTETGNLVLFNQSNATVWQSFDHPVDTLVPGQRLMEGHKITAHASATNSSPGLLYLSVAADGLYGFVDSSPPQIYYFKGDLDGKRTKEPTYLKVMKGKLGLFINSANSDTPDRVISLPDIPFMQYVRLDSDGHLRAYQFSEDFTLNVVDDLLGIGDDCSYPTVCGDYGICRNDQCSCPMGMDGGVNYFQPTNSSDPSRGCSANTPLSCQTPGDHHLIRVNDVSYFNYIGARELTAVNEESCTNSCLSNCSCKAALFQNLYNVGYGSCFLLSHVFSLKDEQTGNSTLQSSIFIKVQTPVTSTTKRRRKHAVVVGISLGASFVAFVIVGICVVQLRKGKSARKNEEDEYFVHLSGTPTRFSYEDLRSATEDFSRKLGHGGFGSVFEGTLSNGVKVAVKRLDGIGQGKKEFLTEVETIGSIHHVNLVRLIGFCAEKSYRLLVYEYMSNGSLDKWIFHKTKNQGPLLDWKLKQKIILDVAKGLSYLHEECTQRIVHLDIKPQNILLDDNFNAKVSDFGLAKLIDRDQSQVMTTMRGTPGYLAPEWLNSIITEKVDVFSFGVVVLEITCERKNLDYSEKEEDVHLLSVLKQKMEEDQLFKIIEEDRRDVKCHGEEAEKMIRIGMWCSQSDHNRRPTMSMVVKVLEGVMDLEIAIDHSISTQAHATWYPGSSSIVVESVLSGPR